MFFFNTDLITETVIDTLALCYFKLIPSIFPYMILSSVIVQSGIISKLNGNSQKNILGICRTVFEIVSVSWISGFIIGPKHLNEQGITQDTTAYVVLSSNAGMGFVISYVGAALWNNIFFGIFLYFVQLVTSIIMFNISEKKGVIQASVTHYPLLTSITNSIQASTRSMLDICGFTVFFSIIKSLINLTFHFKNNSILSVTASALLEISGGTFSSVGCNNVLACAFFTGFAVGFGGLCMCFQTISVCSNLTINKFKFIRAKLIHGIICGAMSLIYALVFKIEPIKATALNLEDSLNLTNIIISTFFVFLTLCLLKKFIKEKIY